MLNQCRLLRACLKTKKFNKDAPLRGIVSIFNARKNEQSAQKAYTKKYTFIMRTKHWGKSGKVIF
ncbi:MAG: hypothetical protein CRN43_08375 [Candidatus Nephrothrix sp. EaCA]|nr:MAG: hypothetical protein CRN43_08375 [Candidatus Nephrothrix sp. EaCA]